MAGHSKWKQIKRKKAVTDQRRGALFTRLIREITIAAKQGGGDAGGNARLRTAIDPAKAEHKPEDNVDRELQKETSELEGNVVGRQVIGLRRDDGGAQASDAAHIGRE